MIQKIRQLQAEHWVSAFLILTLIYSYVLSPSNEKLYQIVLAPLIAALLDAVIYRMKDKKWEFPWLGLISGLIIAALLAPSVLFAVAVPIIAIVLKHAIKFKNRNVFNPAALGLLIATFIGGFVSWWAVSALVIPFGIIAVYKIRRYYNAAAFLIAYFILIALSGFNIVLLDYPILFFALIMLIEPVTTPSAKKGQIIFGVVTAILATVLAIYTRIDFFLAALLVMNLFTYWLNRVR